MQDVSSDPLPTLAPRDPESHKGTYGRVLIIGGSLGMAGAPALAGMAALRSGAGLVTLAVPKSIQATVAGFEPSYMTLGFGTEEQEGISADSHFGLGDLTRMMTVVGLGPGLGTASNLRTNEVVRSLYAEVLRPMVVDADGLNALAEDPKSLKWPGGPRILTPHPGEFQRLTGEEISVETEQRVEQASRLCARDESQQTIVVLKGHKTIVCEGQQYSVNTTGNPGMAAGGTGDCLTGIITALVAQGLKPFDAARLGVHVHGLAGDLAAKELGQVSMIASDLIRFLPQAFVEMA